MYRPVGRGPPAPPGNARHGLRTSLAFVAEDRDQVHGQSEYEYPQFADASHVGYEDEEQEHGNQDGDEGENRVCGGEDTISQQQFRSFTHASQDGVSAHHVRTLDAPTQVYFQDSLKTKRARMNE